MPTQNIFIDTNILLHFYSYSKENLEEIKKIVAAIEKKQLRVFLPAQVVDEFARNREGVIAEAIARMEKQNLPKEFPKIVHTYDAYDKIRAKIAEVETLRAQMLADVRQAAAQRQLEADKVINSLLGTTAAIPLDKTITDSARLRLDLGKPPGKGGSLGDAINWECLLKYVPVGEEIHIITDDSDYCSPLNTAVLSEYLSDEWKSAKKCGAYLYGTLSGFFWHPLPCDKICKRL